MNMMADETALLRLHVGSLACVYTSLSADPVTQSIFGSWMRVFREKPLVTVEVSYEEALRVQASLQKIISRNHFSAEAQAIVTEIKQAFFTG